MFVVSDPQRVKFKGEKILYPIAFENGLRLILKFASVFNQFGGEFCQDCFSLLESLVEGLNLALGKGIGVDQQIAFRPMKR